MGRLMDDLAISGLSASQSAESIYEVMQASYQVEADLLKVDDFFPLRRTAANIHNSDNRFIGCYVDNRLAGVLELEKVDDGSSLIASTVVHPNYFRRGVASALLESLLSDRRLDIIQVSTAAKNLPAIRLYQKFGFVIFNRTMLPDGMELVKLKRNNNQ